MQLILMSHKDEENMVATNHKNSETTDFVEKDESLKQSPSNFKNFLKTGKESQMGVKPATSLKFKYIYLQILFLLNLFIKRKITLKKIINFAVNFVRHLQKKTRAGKYPSIIVFETTNHCNLFCTGCRTTTTNLLDYSGKNVAPIPMGKMNFDSI